MKYIEVETQDALDKALKDKAADDIIMGDGEFVIYGSSQLTACGSSQVRASGSSQVTACDSSQVTAVGSSQVRAFGSSQVRASDSSQVRAYDFSQVRAYDSSQVRAYDSSQVTAFGSSQVTAYGSSQVTATKYVAVTKQHSRVKVDGGVLIDVSAARMTPKTWCEFYGVEVGELVTLFKAVRDDYSSVHGMLYAPGSMPEAPDWDGGEQECGGGLHFSPRPWMAQCFDDEATRFVACPVRLDEIVVHTDAQFPDKVKVPRVAGPCYEVDQDGERDASELREAAGAPPVG